MCVCVCVSVAWCESAVHCSALLCSAVLCLVVPVGWLPIFGSSPVPRPLFPPSSALSCPALPHPSLEARHGHLHLLLLWLLY